MEGWREEGWRVEGRGRRGGVRDESEHMEWGKVERGGKAIQLVYCTSCHGNSLGVSLLGFHSLHT